MTKFELEVLQKLVDEMQYEDHRLAGAHWAPRLKHVLANLKEQSIPRLINVPKDGVHERRVEALAEFISCDSIEYQDRGKSEVYKLMYGTTELFLEASGDDKEGGWLSIHCGAIPKPTKRLPQTVDDCRKCPFKDSVGQLHCELANKPIDPKRDTIPEWCPLETLRD